MIVTGNSKIKRSVYLDSEGFRFDTVFHTNPNNFIMGVSGDSVSKMRFDSGKVYDENDKFISFYELEKNNSIVYNNNNITFLVNDKVFSCAKNRSSVISGDSYLFFENLQTGNVSLSSYLKSSTPSISYLTSETNDSYNFSGKIVNNSSKSIKVFDFSGVDVLKTSFDSTILPGETGSFVYSGLVTGGLTGTHNIDFHYNFGRQNKDVSYYNPTLVNTPTGILNYSFRSPAKNFSSILDITYNWETDTDLSIEFIYESGYGDVYQSTTLFDAYGSGDYSGIIEGSGILYSTNLVGTGEYSFYNNSNLYTGIATGTNGIGQVGYELTGPVSLNYLLYSEGYESGVLSYGYLLGETIVNLNPGDGGRYTFSSFPVTGVPQIAYEIANPLNIFNPATGNFTGYLNGEYTLSSYITLNTGSVMTAATSNILIGTKDLTGVFALKTGYLGEDFTDYYTNGYYSGNTYSGQSSIPSGLRYIQAQLVYSDLLTTNIDSGRFRVSNGVVTEYINFYGV